MIDQAFISASSWSVRGISTPAEDKVTVKRAVASASRQKNSGVRRDQIRPGRYMAGVTAGGIQPNRHR